MKFSKVMVSFAAFVMLVGSSTLVRGQDGCKNVKFKIKNQRGVRIRLNKVEYFNKTNNRRQTEGLKQTPECANGATCTTDGDTLKDSEGVDLTNFRFYFNDQESDGDWSSTDVHTQLKVPATQKCSADMTYTGSPVWTINP